MKLSNSQIFLFVILLFSSNALIAQVHRDSLRIAYLKAFAGMSNEFGFYSTLRIDYTPTFSQQFGARKLYFTATCETTPPPIEPDFQFSVTEYDSAVVLKLVECEDMQSGKKMSTLAFKFPDSSDEALSKMIRWKADTLVLRGKDNLARKLVQDIWNLKSGVVPPDNQIQMGPHYVVFCSTDDGMSYLQFSEGTNDCQGRALAVWIRTTYKDIKGYIRQH